MAVAGAWRAAQSGPVPYVQSVNGAGVHAIHAVRTGDGRNTAPDGSSVLVPEQLEMNDGYTTEDETSTLWGYGYETGTESRPGIDQSETDRRNTTADFPVWGRYEGGLPGGSFIRSKEHGAVAGHSSKLDPVDDVLQGWENKQHLDSPENSLTSDVSQYEMNTSMTQRDKTLAGSQASGRDSQYDAPIKSRIPGMRMKLWSGRKRHDDMQPKAQDVIYRPFWLRTAANGQNDPTWIQVNAMNETNPLQRTVPDSPYVPTSTVAPYDDSADVVHGYTQEDVVW